MHVDPHTCTAYYTQTSHSSIFSTPMDPMLPPTANYTYRNFRFNPSFAIDDRKTPRAFWFEQYQNPNTAGDNGYSLQLMSADLKDLNGRTSVLSRICHSHQGELIVDPSSGDVIFQSTGATSTSGVQHYCYRSAGAKSSTLFYRNSASYRATNIAVDWKTRLLYVSGTNANAIRKVSIDAKNPDSNKEVVVATNTSANAMGIAGDTLYYVQVSSYGQRRFQSSVLYSCKPGSGRHLGNNGSRSVRSGGRDGNPCNAQHATNLSGIPHAFSDQFSTIGLIAESDASLVFSSRRGNSVARALSRYDVQAKTWEEIHVTPFSNPVALGAGTDPSSKKKRLHFIDGTFSTFGSFTPLAEGEPGPFNVPFEISGSFVALSKLGT